MIGTEFDEPAVSTPTGGMAWTRDASRIAVGIFALALVLRVSTVLGLWLSAPHPIESLLGPDSRQLLAHARYLAARDFQLSAHPAAVLGTYHVGAKYLFGVAVWFGAGLFQLQLLNCALGALAASLTYVAAYVAGFRRAWIPGVLVAANPSVILLSSFDLLKDPSVMCATMAAVCGILLGFSNRQSERLARRLLPWGIVALALVYLRMSRFYVATFIEGGMIAAVLVMAFTANRHDRAFVGLWAVCTIALSEAIPAFLGWPTSVSLVLARLAPAMAWHDLRYRTADGLARRIIASVISSEAGRKAMFLIVDAARRLFGPFVWVVPPRWDQMTIVYSGDYLLYPGTLAWYALQPYVIAGIWASRRVVLSSSMERLWLVVLSGFVGAYLLQFALVSLSYRQRDAMFPVFLLLAFAGNEESVRWKSWKYWYAAYWLGIVVMAGVHLTVSDTLRR